MGDDATADDPGWPSIGLIVLAVIPGIGMRMAMRRTPDALTMLRTVFLAFSGAIVAFGVVLAFLKLPGGPVVPWLPILVVFAAAQLVFVPLIMKPLDCSSPAALAVSYRTRFFLVIAFSESVALFAFVFTFIGGPRWIYYVGGAFALFRFWTVVPPTRAGIARDQERLAANGCELSLVAALRSAPPGGRTAF